MNDLVRLSALIRKRNALARAITALIGRPAQLEHIGEYIAATIFHIELTKSASRKGIDGHFSDGPLKGRTVNIKWYTVLEGLLDISTCSLPDYYLVLAGPWSAAGPSRGRSRPWVIESVFLFEAKMLIDELKRSGVTIGVASSVCKGFWTKAEIYPAQRNAVLELSEEQRAALALFSSKAVG